MAIKVLIVDDHQLFREGLANLIGGSGEIEIIAEAENAGQAIKMTSKLNPDVIIMDIGLPEINGIEATKILKKKYPDIKIIALSMHSDKHYIKGMLEAGASGYLLKNSTHNQVMDAVKSVYSGKKYLSSTITEVLIDNYLGKDEPSGEESKLTQRESEILKMIAEGISTREIAKKLFVSVKTIGTHKQNILEKLNLKSTTDLVKYAIKNEIISLD